MMGSGKCNVDEIEGLIKQMQIGGTSGLYSKTFVPATDSVVVL